MKRAALALLRIGLGAAFLYAGIQKVADPWAFADSVFSFQLLPAVLITPFALGLPMFEVLLGAMLLGNRGARPAALGTLFLCVVFAIALGSALIRGLDVDCGCFGSGSWASNPWMALGRDLLLGMASFAVLLSARERKRQSA